MWSRKRIDLCWSDLLAAAVQSAASRRPASLAAKIEREWSLAGDALACLSVRSAFDLLLASLDLPRGSEVLVSAVTISGMLRIIESRGLIAVPVDLDPLTMAPLPESLDRGVSPRSRVLLVAHLFGGRVDLERFANFASRHRLLLIEDAAQAFAGLDYTGHPQADVSLFSFGPIKTATALGGAMAKVRDQQLLERMRVIQATWPLQKRVDLFARVVKYALLKALSSRPAYRLLMDACGLLGYDHDRLVNGSVRAFDEREFFSQLRRRPSAPLLSLLRRRLKRLDRRRIARRVDRAEQIVGGRRGTMLFPGSACSPHAHWLLPVCVRDARRLITRLAAAGYDATQGQSLIVVPAPAGREELDAVNARTTLGRIVFLPCYPEMTPAAVGRLARLVGQEIDRENRESPSCTDRLLVDTRV